MNQPVDLVFDGSVAVVSLNAPPLNIFNLEMRDELISAFEAINDVLDIKSMVLRAQGPHFSAGADLSEFGSAESIFEARRIRWDRDPWGLLGDLRVPTVASLHGTALGSGLEMSLLCDIRVAAPNTVLGLPETKLGMLPAAGGSQSLTKAIGTRDAVGLITRAVSIGAEEAKNRSLVHMVTENAEAESLAIAHRLASLDPGLVLAARRAIRGAQDLPLSAGLKLEADLQAGLLDVEGLAHQRRHR